MARETKKKKNRKERRESETGANRKIKFLRCTSL